jgi:hypothetical protein
VAQALRAARAAGIALLEPESPEGRLAHAWCLAAVGPGRVLAGRWEPGWLTAHPANKTALLLGEVPPALLLPLGDLYASEVAQLAGDWSAPATVRALAELAGDVASLDAALRRWVEERRPLPEALSALPPAAAAAITAALEHTWLARRHCGLVPKLGSRTLGVDLRQ